MDMIQAIWLLHMKADITMKRSSVVYNHEIPLSFLNECTLQAIPIGLIDETVSTSQIL